MAKSSKTELRVAHILKKMDKAMPEIRRQIAVYERKIKLGKQVKSSKTAPQFRDV